MGKKGGGGGSSTQTTKVELPKWVEDKSKQTAGWGERLMDNPYQTYGGQRVAQFSPDQRSAMSQTRQQAHPSYQQAGRNQVRGGIRNVGAGGSRDAVRELSGGPRSAVRDVSNGPRSAVRDVSNGPRSAVRDVSNGPRDAVRDAGDGEGYRSMVRDIGDGRGYRGMVRNVGDGEGYRDMVRNLTADQTSTSLWDQSQATKYMNPYMDAVADTTAADMERAREVQQRSAGDQAASAGAFGGARHGVADAESNRNFYDRMGATMGDLRHQGYGQAASIFGQDMGRQLQSDTGNANRTLQADSRNQSMDNAGAQRRQQNSLSNQAMDNAGAQRRLQAASRNQSMDNAGAQRRQQNTLANQSMDNAFQERDLRADQSNQSMDNAFQERDLRADQSNQSMDNAFQERGLRAGQSNQAMDNAHLERSQRGSMANQRADMQSYGLWDGMYNNQVGATQRLGQQGADQQSQRQRVLDQEYSDWMTLQQAPYERANFLTGILGGTPYGKTTTGPAPQQQGPSAAQSILGAGTTLGAAYLMSDRRVKRDVERIGTDEETGLRLYAYRYLWSDAPQVGVMADEVRRVRPDAVSTGALTGLDMVDYSKLGIAA